MYPRVKNNIKKAGLLFCLILISIVNTNAQRNEIDSLLRLISKQKDDTFKSYLMAEAAYCYHVIWPDSTRIMAKKAYDLAVKLDYKKGKADAMKHLAIGSYIGGEFNKAIEFNKQSLEIYESIGEKKGQGAVLNNIAIIMQDQGKYDSALVYYRKSIVFREQIKDSIGLSGGYNNMGNTYSDMGIYSESLHYLFKALSIREKIGDNAGIGHSYSNIARIYHLLGKLDEAFRYADKGYKIFENLGNPDGMAHSAMIIGGVYHERKEHDKAIRHFNEAMKFYIQVQNYPNLMVAQVNAAEELTTIGRYKEAEELYRKALALAAEGGDREGMAISNIGLGMISLKTGKIKEGITLLNTGLQTAREIGSKLRISEASKELANAYKADGDFMNANKALETFIIYKDSLFIEESAKKAEEIQYNFLLDKKQKEIALLEKDKMLRETETERQRLISLVLVITLLFVLFGVFLMFRSRQKERLAKKLIIDQKVEIEKQAVKLEELNALKDKTFSVLSHDLRSPVSSLTGVMTLLEENILSPEEFRQQQIGFSSQLKSLSQVLDNLLYWSKGHMSGIPQLNKTKVDVKEIISQNQNLLKESASQKNIRIITENVGDESAYADRDDVDIVFRNLLSNAIKFTRPDGEINVSTKRSNNQLHVSVTDNGIGMDEVTLANLLTRKPKEASYGTSGEKGTGIGLLICKEFIEKNGGTLTVKSEKDKGSEFTFTLPLA